MNHIIKNILLSAAAACLITVIFSAAITLDLPFDGFCRHPTDKNNPLKIPS